MSLKTYQKKRDFTKTTEPKGRVEADHDVRRFVIHEHHSSVMHFDFRLEIGGVLKSWSVPRGPSLDPGHRRLAVQVEDHPVSYASFDGTIPEGEYGAGRSLIWDEGTFTLADGEDAEKAWDAGKISFTLEGKKLRGTFTLARMKGRGRATKPQWLLLKKNDATAQPGWRLELEEPDVRFQPDGPSGRTKAKAKTKRTVTEVKTSERLGAPAFLERLGTLVGDIGLKVGRATVPLTHIDKVYWKKEKYTKADLLAYYLRVGKLIMPHLKGRPAILKRYPNGAGDEGFYQHDIVSAPALLETKQLVSETNRKLNYAVYTDLASLLYLVNMGTIAQNPWLSPLDHLDNPDYIVFDLDPKAAPFKNVLATALNARRIFDELKLTNFVKTSGSSGIHLYIPIKPKYSYEEAAQFAEAVATRIAEANPKIATVERALAERSKNQVYVDWQQNAHGKSVAAVYSVRAKPGATVSAPVTWEEVERGFKLSDFTIASMPERLDVAGDLWKDFFKRRQSLPTL